jgi:Uma2 family endonuclease
MDVPDGLTAADYEALPEDICRRIEIVDGAIIVNAAPRRLHQDICRRLAHALEAACGTALTVSTGVDLRLRDIPLLNRRPDAVLYDAALPDDVLLRPQHCKLVVEVMSRPHHGHVRVSRNPHREDDRHRAGRPHHRPQYAALKTRY